MSVYTSISEQEFSELLKSYSLGLYQSSQGIHAGIENTNYFVTTTKAEFVFTLFEQISYSQSAFYMSLLQNLSLAGINCPQPQADNHGNLINTFNNKPFSLVTRLKGKNINTANINQCQAIATELAKIHTTAFSTISLTNPLLYNRRGKAWRDKVANKILKQLSASDAEFLSRELPKCQAFDDSQLPRGLIHADLFKDNALFDGDQLCGVIDFNDACYDTYLYDIAITVNAWCCNTKGELKQNFVDAFFDAYQCIRPLSSAEKEAWPSMLKIAAMRFWLSRLQDAIAQDSSSSNPEALTHQKNPHEYRQILQNHVELAIRGIT